MVRQTGPMYIYARFYIAYDWLSELSDEYQDDSKSREIKV